MIQFPETAVVEWEHVALVHNKTRELRKRIELDTQVERAVETLRIRHEAALLFQQELDAGQTPVLEMMTLSNYKANPATAPSDLIEGVVKHNGLTIMLGPSSSGKSTLALQACHSLMTGDPWLGQDVNKISGGVGILSYDMDAGLMLDWMAGFPNIDPDKVSVVNAHKRGNPVGVPAIRGQIAAHWKQLGVEVVVVDSFSASFFGQDQNDAGSTQAYYRDMLLFALTEVGAKALIVIVHSTDSNPNKARGSTVQHDVADSIVAVEVDKNTQSRTVRMVKYRQHRDTTGHMTHQMNPVVITAPDDVTHLVSLDPGAMTLKNMTLPAASGAAAFAPPVVAHEAPDTDSDSEQEGDDDL